jgi:NAD(P)H-dependent FMN reductase
MPLNTAVVYGSARRNRQGIKAARFIVRKLEARGHNASLVDSLACNLPMLDLMYKEYEGDAPEAMESTAETFRDADGFVIVSGEYNHSIPAALKNLLDHFQVEYLYKPSALVTYSAGPFGGVRALINLRGIMAELGAASIPSALPISHVQRAFTTTEMRPKSRTTGVLRNSSTNTSGMPMHAVKRVGRNPARKIRRYSSRCAVARLPISPAPGFVF